MARPVSALPLASGLTALAVVPFAAGVYYAFAHAAGDAAHVLHWLLPWLAAVVSFIGGIQWGRMLASGQAPPEDMVLAGVPALIAWPALLIGEPWTFIMLLGALIIGWLIDEYGARQGWQHRGYLHLRRVATLIVVVCIVAVGWRVMRG